MHGESGLLRQASAIDFDGTLHCKLLARGEMQVIVRPRMGAGEIIESKSGMVQPSGGPTCLFN